jgi:formylmethanofuran dehydrogenase subunit E
MRQVRLERCPAVATRYAAWVLSATALVGLAPAFADGPGADVSRAPSEVDAALANVRAVRRGVGPSAVDGYRMGERALKELDLPRQSFALLVVHKTPMQEQYSFMADGLQAATGASLGKLNLRLEKAPSPTISTTVADRKSGRRPVFTIDPELAASITNLPHERLKAERRRVAALPDDKLFRVIQCRDEAKDAAHSAK